jgi:Ca-activated chloride channel family protein
VARRLIHFLMACAGGATLIAQEPANRDVRTFRSGVELTVITATVRDAQGRLVTGLTRDAFEVFEDGERQEVAQFTNERVAVGLGVLLDTSDSMFGQRIKDARAAVERFLFDLLGERDEYFVMAFNHYPRPLSSWTHMPDEVRKALERIKPSGGTAVYDGVLASLPMFSKRSPERGALVIISDGADTASNASLREIRSALLRNDTFVYAIGIDSPDRRAINTRVNEFSLREITDDSGGRTEIVHSSAELADATSRIAEELNSQYMLGYSPSHEADGKYHSIRVRVTGTDYKVRTRNGYVR